MNLLTIVSCVFCLAFSAYSIRKAKKDKATVKLDVSLALHAKIEELGLDLSDSHRRCLDNILAKDWFHYVRDTKGFIMPTQLISDIVRKLDFRRRIQLTIINIWRKMLKKDT